MVNERDELGPNLVPDYLTSVQEGGFYGWPYSYWGQHEDSRVQPHDPAKVAAAIASGLRPGLARGGARVSPSRACHSASSFADGVFVGRTRQLESRRARGIQGRLRAFPEGRPAGDPIDFVTGFQVDGKTFGRPVGVTVDPRGALIVADDLSNTLWRVTPSR